MANGGVSAMGQAVPVRTDYTAGEVRRFAKRAKDAAQARRLLAIAAVLDGVSREEAAKLGGMDRQTLRDWVIRFNEQGPDGLINIPSPGAPPKLDDMHKAFLRRIVDDRLSPSGIIGGNGLPFERVGRPATLNQIRGAIEAYGAAACTAKALGFDGVEIHGAHGSLRDQFLWNQTSRRENEYGGDIGRRTRFATEVIQEIRANVGPDFPVVLRLSTWKPKDYNARVAG